MIARRFGGSTVRGVSVVAIAVITLVTCAFTSGVAGADQNSGTPAVVGPLLRMLNFGDTVGLPLACEAGLSLVSAIEGQTNSSGELSPIANEIGAQCQNLSKQGGDYLQQAQSESSALEPVNPVLDPGIAEMASSIQTVGNNYGASLSPFGPTIAGLGGSVTFFEGS